MEKIRENLTAIPNFHRWWHIRIHRFGGFTLTMAVLQVQNKRKVPLFRQQNRSIMNVSHVFFQQQIADSLQVSCVFPTNYILKQIFFQPKYDQNKLLGKKRNKTHNLPTKRNMLTMPFPSEKWSHADLQRIWNAPHALLAASPAPEGTGQMSSC